MKKEDIDKLDNSNNSMDLIFNSIENDEYEKNEIKYFYKKLSQRF